MPGDCGNVASSVQNIDICLTAKAVTEARKWKTKFEELELENNELREHLYEQILSGARWKNKAEDLQARIFLLEQTLMGLQNRQVDREERCRLCHWSSDLGEPLAEVGATNASGPTCSRPEGFGVPACDGESPMCSHVTTKDSENGATIAASGRYCTDGESREASDTKIQNEHPSEVLGKERTSSAPSEYHGVRSPGSLVVTQVDTTSAGVHDKGLRKNTRSLSPLSYQRLTEECVESRRALFNRIREMAGQYYRAGRRKLPVLTVASGSSRRFW